MRVARRLELGVVAAASLALVGLHAVFLGHAGGLWRDEVNSAEFAAMPLATLGSMLGLDSVPLLSTLGLKLWRLAPWASDPAGLRVFGFVVGLAILAAFWYSARVLGARTPWAAVALLGFNLVAIRSTDAIRPYGIGTLTAVLAFTLVWKLLERPGLARFLLAATATIAAAQSMYANVPVLLGIGLAGIAVALRRRRSRSAVLIAAAGVLAGLSLVPYGAAVRAARDWSAVVRFESTFPMLWGALRDALAAGAPFSAVLWAALAGATILGARRAAADGRAGPDDSNAREARAADAALYSALALVLSTIAVLATLKSTRLLTRPWYFMPMLAVDAAAIDGGLAGAWPATGRGALRPALAAGIVAVCAVLAYGPLASGLAVRQTNLDLVAQRLEADAGAGDLILVDPWYIGVGFHHYYHGRTRWMTIPPLSDLRIHRYDLIKRSMMSVDPIGGVLEATGATLRSGGRVWFVGQVSNPPATVRVLPPASASEPLDGARRDAFLASWAMQCLAFLAAHATAVAPVDLAPAGPVNPLEDVPLYVFSGWR